jgi:hypothetical protein
LGGPLDAATTIRDAPRLVFELDPLRRATRHCQTRSSPLSSKEPGRLIAAEIESRACREARRPRSSELAFCQRHAAGRTVLLAFLNRPRFERIGGALVLRIDWPARTRSPADARAGTAISWLCPGSLSEWSGSEVATVRAICPRYSERSPYSVNPSPRCKVRHASCLESVPR